MSDGFSKAWFETFLAPSTAPPVHRELAFIRQHLPVREFPRLLDVPCGIGRHAVPLVTIGYAVLGVDRSPEAIEQARRSTPDGGTYELLDMRQLDRLPSGAFDAVLCLWQSFGYGDAEENADVFRSMTRRLRAGGRLLIDIYNRDALGSLPPEATESRAGRTVMTRRTLAGRRFNVEIGYSDSDDVDQHGWLVYSLEEIVHLGQSAGLVVICSCAMFDPALPPGPEYLRMQVLFELPAETKEPS